MAKHLIGLCLCAMAGAGCASDLPRPSQVPIGRPFELRPATSATLEDGVAMTFVGVRSDSRCPMDVVCVWAGDASVAVRLTSRTGGEVERELHTNPGSGREADVSYLAYAITLVSVAPYPRSDRQIPPGDYVATFTVARH